MGKTYWMLVTTEENFEITRSRGFKTQGIESSQRRKASRFAREDRLLYYLVDRRAFAATATVTKERFEERSNVWNHHDANESFPHRIGLRPDVLLEADQFIDALEVGPRLDYVRKWAPEDWHLAFLGPLHILPQRDFSFIEEEMKRIRSPRSGGRSGRRRRNSRGRERRESTPSADGRDGAPDSTAAQENAPESVDSPDDSARQAAPAGASGGDGALRESQDAAQDAES